MDNFKKKKRRQKNKETIAKIQNLILTGSTLDPAKVVGAFKVNNNKFML